MLRYARFTLFRDACLRRRRFCCHHVLDVISAIMPALRAHAMSVFTPLLYRRLLLPQITPRVDYALFYFRRFRHATYYDAAAAMPCCHAAAAAAAAELDADMITLIRHFTMPLLMLSLAFCCYDFYAAFAIAYQLRAAFFAAFLRCFVRCCYGYVSIFHTLLTMLPRYFAAAAADYALRCCHAMLRRFMLPIFATISPYAFRYYCQMLLSPMAMLMLRC